MIPLTSIRRTIAERMTASVREAPQFTVSVDADMTRSLAIVEDLKAGAAADQPRITLTTLLIRACAWSLARHPEANSAFVDGQIAEWDEVNVGVATAIDAGLIVSVIRGADKLGMRAIAAQLAELTSQGARGTAQAGRPARRHVHPLQPGNVRHRPLHSDPEPAAGSHPGSGPDRQAACGG